MKKPLFIASTAILLAAFTVSCGGFSARKADNRGSRDTVGIRPQNESFIRARINPESYIGYPDFITAPTVGNGYIFVSAQHGSDEGDGSFNSPYGTVSHALSKAKEGDTVYIRGGTYRESAVVNNRGTKDKFINIVAYNGEKPVFDCRDSQSPAAFTFTGSSAYIRISGIEICNYSSSGICVKEGAQNIIIEDVKIHDISTPNYTENSSQAILGSGKNILIKNCELFDIGQDRMTRLDSCINLGKPENWGIDSNSLSNAPGAGIQQYSNNAKQSAGKNVYIQNNVIKNCKYGFSLSSCDRFFISNNDVINVNSSYFYISADVKDCVIQNNIFLSLYKSGSLYSAGEWNSDRIKQAKVQSNLIVCSAKAQFENNTITNNILFQALDCKICVGGKWSGVRDAADFDADNTYDALFETDPLLTSAENSDYTPQEDGPCISTGISNAYTPKRNMCGKKRETVNIGAY